MKNILLFFTVLFTLALSFNLSAQEGDLKSMDQIAKEMSNPTLPMFNLAMFYDYQNTTGNLSGANNQNINLIGIQPPLPFPLKNGKNLIIRPLFSFNFAAPVFNENGFESAGGVHFGDIFSPQISKASPGFIIQFLGWCLLVLPLPSRNAFFRCSLVNEQNGASAAQ